MRSARGGSVAVLAQPCERPTYQDGGGQDQPHQGPGDPGAPSWGMLTLATQP